MRPYRPNHQTPLKLICHFFMLSREAPAATPADGPQVEGVSLWRTCYAGNRRTELPAPDTDYEVERRRAVDKLTPNGVKPLTDDETKAEHKMTKKLLKKAAKSIFTTDPGQFCFPVAYSEPRSFLERISDMFSFLACEYISRALEEDEPERRLTIITVGVLACLHLDMQSKKPFNPILGETVTRRWANGAQFWGEQTSHHPPISDVIVIGPDQQWKITAHTCAKVENGMKAVNVLQEGVFKLQLESGEVYEWEFPPIHITGNVSGDRLVKVKGSLTVTDKKNGLECCVEVGPKRDKKKGLDNPVATTIYGGARSIVKKGGDLLTVVTGDYCGQVFVDDELIWDIEDSVATRPTEEIPDDELLPSDCRFRLDRNLFIDGKMEAADAAKKALEEAQRREAKLRKKSKKSKKGKKSGKPGGASEQSASELPSVSSSKEDLRGMLAQAADLSSDRSESGNDGENDTD